MTQPRAVIYVRLSKDKHGLSPGVARQEDLCRRLADAAGYAVAAVMGAKDGSAVHDPRPDFDDMIRRAHAGEWDVIVGYANDRLSRGYEDTGLLLSPGLPIHTVLGGRTDPTAEGRVHTKLASALAEFETERKRERMRDENAQRRANGIPPSGPKLPGLERDLEHADMIRAGWRRVLDGESLSQLAREWSAAGVRTVTGRQPGPNDVARWLRKQRYAGRLPDGTAGSRPGLVDPDTFDAVQALFADRTRAPRPGGKLSWPLSVVAVCGRCRGRMRSIRNGKGGRHHAYACAEHHHLVRGGDLPDRFVFGLTADRLELPDAAGLLSPTIDVGALLLERDAVQARWDALAELVASGDLRPDAVRDRVAPLRARVEDLTGQITAATVGSPLEGIPGPGARERLAGVVPRRLAMVYQALYEAVVLEPPPHRGYRFTEDDPGITVEWR